MASKSTTGTVVKNAVSIIFPSAGVPAADASWVILLNLAIRSAWPVLRITERSTTAFTIASGTFDYSMGSLSPVPDRQLGIAKVFIQDAGATTAPDELHKVEQYFDGSADAWYVRLQAWQASQYNGKVANVIYQYQHPDITAIGETIYMPEDYLVHKCVAFLAQQLYLSPASTSTNRYGDVWQDNMKRADQILQMHRGENLESLRIISR